MQPMFSPLHTHTRARTDEQMQTMHCLQANGEGLVLFGVAFVELLCHAVSVCVTQLVFGAPPRPLCVYPRTHQSCSRMALIEKHKAGPLGQRVTEKVEWAKQRVFVSCWSRVGFCFVFSNLKKKTEVKCSSLAGIHRAKGTGAWLFISLVLLNCKCQEARDTVYSYLFLLSAVVLEHVMPPLRHSLPWRGLCVPEKNRPSYPSTCCMLWNRNDACPSKWGKLTSLVKKKKKRPYLTKGSKVSFLHVSLPVLFPPCLSPGQGRGGERERAIESGPPAFDRPWAVRSYKRLWHIKKTLK